MTVNRILGAVKQIEDLLKGYTSEQTQNLERNLNFDHQFHTQSVLLIPVFLFNYDLSDDETTSLLNLMGETVADLNSRSVAVKFVIYQLFACKRLVYATHTV